MTSMTCSGFIFDMDGTLVDNMAFHTQSWLEMFAELGIEMTPGRLARLMGSHTTPELLRHVLAGSISGQDIDRHSERKEVIYRKFYGPHLRAVAGVHRFLREAQALGIPMAVATSAGRRNIEFTLDGLGLNTCFNVIVGGDDVLQGKSGPQIFLTTAQKLGISPGQCLVFEDSQSGVEAAHLAGMHVIVIATNPQAEEFRVPSSVLDVVSDFSGLDPASLVTTIGHAGEHGTQWRGERAVRG